MGLCFSCKASNASITVSDEACKLYSEICNKTNEDYINSIPLKKLNEANRRRNMANSFNNMNITLPLKEFVSKNRIRYVKDGFNLDLTYITPRLIAMGYPASKIEGCYRNHIDDVVKLLDTKHKDHYKIYNLCSERSYDARKFHNRVKTYAFDDHNPPRIDLIEPFCRDVDEWLNEDPHNVAVVHCKAGKGRTGTMICCYLLHSKIHTTAVDALCHYGQERTLDSKGVTIPSQVRYVEYYARLVRERLQYEPIRLYICDIILDPPPTFTSGQGGVYISISGNPGNIDSNGKRAKLYKSNVYDIKKGVQQMKINFDACVPIIGDIKLELYSKSKISKVKQLQFWFNTFFVNELRVVGGDVVGSGGVGGLGLGGGGGGGGGGVVVGGGGGGGGGTNGFYDQNGGLNHNNHAPLVLTLNKNELDIVNKKDKSNKVFRRDFKITLIMQRVPSKSVSWLNNPSPGDVLPSGPDSHSGSSENDSSDEDDDEESEWDSVVESENLDPRGVGYRLLSECELASQLTSSSHEQHAELLAA